MQVTIPGIPASLAEFEALAAAGKRLCAAHAVPAQRIGGPAATGSRTGLSARLSQDGGRGFAPPHEAAAETVDR